MIKPVDELVHAPRIDNTGVCFVDINEHYFRQESKRVLHVAVDIVNALPENAINDGRLNWDNEYTEIDPQLFDEKLKDVLETFFYTI